MLPSETDLHEMFPNCGCGQDQMEDSEQRNILPRSRVGGQLLDELSDYQFLETDPAPSS
jgi:hypothetical protein